MRKKYNPNKVKIHRSYTALEIADLLKVHIRTVRAWIKAGLPIIDSERPLLVLGVDLRLFLQTKNEKNKQTCLASEMFCVKCQSPQKPILETVMFLQDAELIGRISAKCSQCHFDTNKFFHWEKLSEVGKDLGMTLPIAEKHIIYISHPPTNCTLGGDCE